MAERYKNLLKGAANPNWKGGNFSRENSGVSRSLRIQVLERDNYRCQNCGTKDWEFCPSILHTHHVVEFKNNGKTELDNLITLCFICHWIGQHNYELTTTMREVASRAGISNQYF